MASIKVRNGRYYVIYYYVNEEGKRKQKWESCVSKADAKRRQAEVESHASELKGIFEVPRCKTMKELLDEYCKLYGKDKWSLSSYSRNMRLISNYILPHIGETKIADVNVRFLEAYYQRLLKTPAVINKTTGHSKTEFVSTSTIRDIHKLLRSCFQQARKWEIIDKNPAELATVPKHKGQKREIWTAETLSKAMDACKNDDLKLAINLSFAGSLRMGELLGLTWDCVDITEEAIKNGTASIFINKEVQRVTKEAMEELDSKDIGFVFPSANKATATCTVLKAPKTESSVRRVFIPESVARMLIEHKAKQDEIKELLGEQYTDYGIVMATSYGSPLSDSYIRSSMNKLIKDNDLPKVVFHSLRHASITYKLKLNGGDVKAVQGDSGHAQVNMVTDVYAHIIDEDRRKNAQLMEEAFYQKQNLNPQMHDQQKMVEVPEGVDAEVLAKVLANPEMAALIQALAGAMKK